MGLIFVILGFVRRIDALAVAAGMKDAWKRRQE